MKCVVSNKLDNKNRIVSFMEYGGSMLFEIKQTWQVFSKTLPDCLSEAVEYRHWQYVLCITNSVQLKSNYSHSHLDNTF